MCAVIVIAVADVPLILAAQLSKEQFRILRQKGTEMAGSGDYDKHYPDKVSV